MGIFVGEGRNERRENAVWTVQNPQFVMPCGTDQTVVYFGWATHWRHLANTMNDRARGGYKWSGDAACSQITSGNPVTIYN